VYAPSLEVFKTRLDVQPGLVPDVEIGGPACGMGLERDDPWSPFQHKPFYDDQGRSSVAHINYKNN